MQLDLLLATLSPLLDQAAELGPDARAAWLARLRQERPDLATELETLLGSEEEMTATGFLTGSGAAELLGVPPAGGQVGPYALVRRLGRGGMGSVWLGQRNDGRYEGQVAVKLLSGSLMHPAGAERFRREANALARLTHPGIARLIDAGVSGAGQPYLVLEFVDGVPIDEYCDVRRLTPGQRLELIQQVLDAVTHAHASLVIHRDIKPSNILVTHDGKAKLLDFGIAKLLEPEAGTLETGITDLSALACTPGFAAPEQVFGGAITTATDVYALGVLLYLVLVGRHPTGIDGATTDADLRRIAEAAPVRLSAHTPPEVAALRGMSSDQLRRICAGDLDAILGKALEQTPARRYPTAAALSADLDRFLRHEPVRARPHTLAYRTRRFLRRNRAAVTAGIVAATLLLVTTAYALYQLGQATRQRDEARVQRDRAVFERQRSAASDNFMQALLSTIGSSEQINAGELLGRGRALLEQASRQDPRVAAPLMIQLASQFHSIAGRDGLQAEWELLEQGAESAREGHDPQLEAAAECRLALYAGRTKNDTASATGHWQRARRLLDGVAGAEPAVVANCLLAEAYSSTFAGRNQVAVQLLQRFDSVLSGSADAVSLSGAQQWLDASDVWVRLRKNRSALADVRRCEALLLRLGQSNSMLRLSALTTEAFELDRLGEYRGADSVNQEWLALARRRGADLAAFVEIRAARHALWARAPDSAVRIWRRRAARARGDGTFNEGTLAPLIRALTAAGLFSEARARIAEYALRPEGSAVRLLSLRGQLAEAEGNARQARIQYSALLAALHAPGAREQLTEFWSVVRRSAAAAFVDGDITAADSLARQALDLAHQNEQDDLHSAEIGQTRLLQARIALARHDTASAGALIRLALPPLEHGFGGDRRETLEARALAAQLAAASPVGAAALPD